MTLAAKTRWRSYGYLLIFTSTIVLLAYLWITRVQIRRLEHVPRGAFEVTYSSRGDIERVLSNTTILNSRKDGVGSAVFFFDKDRRFVYWDSNGLLKGEWSVEARLVILTFESEWRGTVAQRFCARFDDPTMGYCYLVQDTNQLINYGLQFSRETREGDIFGLSTRHSPPMRMPNSLLTIDQLLSLGIAAATLSVLQSTFGGFGHEPTATMWSGLQAVAAVFEGMASVEGFRTPSQV